ncbi:MAG TPA: DUF3501 family protein [Polyangiales bacterium]|nr:DUF3501 family protein [Polyangiales bacterium]
MRKVDGSELLDLGAYEQIRERFRNRVIASKQVRRLQLGPHMSLVFENHDTMLLQIQEMIRTERITDQRAIQHELDTYNELLPEGDRLSATLFIEYDDAAQRSDMLRRFSSLRERVVLRVGDALARASFSVHHGEELDRLPAVNYLIFELDPDARSRLADPGGTATLVVDHPDYAVSVALSPQLRAELAHDLAG